MKGPDALGRGWWRRNVWGVVLVAPALAAMVYASGFSYLDAWERGTPEPVAAAADGTASFAGVNLRLVELVEATDLKRHGGDPLTLPEGMTAWRVVFEVEAPGLAEVPYCQISLEDAAGNVYDDNPEELTRADIPLGNCRPDNSPTPAVSGRHRTVAHFVTARGVDAAAARVAFGSTDPTRYLRFAR